MLDHLVLIWSKIWPSIVGIPQWGGISHVSSQAESSEEASSECILSEQSGGCLSNSHIMMLFNPSVLWNGWHSPLVSLTSATQHGSKGPSQGTSKHEPLRPLHPILIYELVLIIVSNSLWSELLLWLQCQPFLIHKVFLEPIIVHLVRE